MDAPRITRVEPEGRSAVLLHFSDGSIVEMVPVRTSGSVHDLDIQQTVMVALRDLLRRAQTGGGPAP